MTTAQKLQEIIEKGGFEAKVAATILNSKNFKCSWKQWETINCSHDELDFSELNLVTDESIAVNGASFQDRDEAIRAEQKRSHLN